MTTWNDYYINHRFRVSNVVLHFPYLLSVLMRRPATILEIGCGPADHSLFIKRLFPSISLYLLDLDSELLQRVKDLHGRDITETYNVDILDDLALTQASIPKADVIISQGLLEHFNDHDFQKIIKNFSTYAPRMIFSLPSHNYPTRDYGNEILRSKSEIEILLNQISGIRYSIVPYIDIGIQTKLLKIKKEKLPLLQAIGYFLFGANHYTVTVNYENFT